MAVEFPDELLKQFEETTFCPKDALPIGPQHGTGWNTLRAVVDEGGHSSYPETLMFYDYHVNGEVKEASRSFGSFSGTKDGVFVKAVIDWLQSMNPHVRDETSSQSA